MVRLTPRRRRPPTATTPPRMREMKVEKRARMRETKERMKMRERARTKREKRRRESKYPHTHTTSHHSYSIGIFSNILMCPPLSIPTPFLKSPNLSIYPFQYSNYPNSIPNHLKYLLI